MEKPYLVNGIAYSRTELIKLAKKFRKSFTGKNNDSASVAVVILRNSGYTVFEDW